MGFKTGIYGTTGRGAHVVQFIGIAHPLRPRRDVISPKVALTEAQEASAGASSSEADNATDHLRQR